MRNNESDAVFPAKLDAHHAAPGAADPTAYLRHHGVEVIQRDLNQEVFDAILTRDFIQDSITRLRHERGPRASRRSKRPASPPPKMRQWALDQGPALAEQIDGAMDVIRGDAFFDGPTGVRAFLTTTQCLQVASLPFYPAALELSTYIPAAPEDSSRNLKRRSRSAAQYVPRNLSP